MKVYLALDDNNEPIGYFADGRVYNDWDDVPRKRGLFKSSIDFDATSVYQGGRLVNLALKIQTESEQNYKRAQAALIASGDALTRALERD